MCGRSGKLVGFKSVVSHVRNTLTAHIRCANDSGDKTLTVRVLDIMCNDISVVDRADWEDRAPCCVCGV